MQMMVRLRDLHAALGPRGLGVCGQDAFLPLPPSEGHARPFLGRGKHWHQMVLGKATCVKTHCKQSSGWGGRVPGQPVQGPRATVSGPPLG